MPVFSKHSLDRLEDADPLLQEIAHLAIKEYDFSVICTYRGKIEQDEAYSKGFSKLKYPKSKHNKKPSLAMDLYPYPSGITKKEKFYELAEVITRVAEGILKGTNYKLGWGGNLWKNFKDLPHYELIEKENYIAENKISIQNDGYYKVLDEINKEFYSQ